MSLNEDQKHSDEKSYVQILVERSAAAQKEIENYTQEQVDLLIQAITWSVVRPGVAEELAELAVEETGLGNFDGKFTKMSVKCRAALMDIIDDKSVGIIEEYPERCVSLVAKPIGVVAGITPITNPEATPVIKAINCIKARNSIILAPHLKARKLTSKLADHMRAALKACGAPEDLIIAMDKPTIPNIGELMKLADVVLATGGTGLVKAAYSSGTPALGVGAGNAVITVDKDADLDFAANSIMRSKTFDYATSCSADNSIIALEPVYDDILAKLQSEGGYLIQEGEYEKIRKILWYKGNLNPRIIAKSAQTIAEMAGVEIGEDKTFIIIPENGIGPEHPFSGEKLCVVLALFKVADIDEAVELTNALQAYQGAGHSCGLYTGNEESIQKFALHTKTSRVMINQPQCLSNSGNLWNGMRQTFTLGCGFWGGNSVNDNIYWRHLVNVSHVSRPLPEWKVLPSDEQLFGKSIELLQ